MVGRIMKGEREEPLHTVRKMLKKGKQTWADLRGGTRCSPTTLSKILKDLEKTGEIKAYRDANDGRITWYEAVGKQITAQIFRYDSARFLEDLKNPTYDGKTAEIDGFKVSMNNFFEGLEKSKEKEVMEASLSSFEWVAQVISMASAISKINKVAMVITAEKIQETQDKEEE